MLLDSRKFRNVITEESDYEPNPKTNVFCRVLTLKLASVNQASNYTLNLRLSQREFILGVVDRIKNIRK